MLEPEPGRQQTPRYGSLAARQERGGFTANGGKHDSWHAEADVFYRLKGMVLCTPALSKRPDDVTLLATVFLRRVDPGAVLTPDATEWLVNELLDTALLRFVARKLDDVPVPARSSPSTLAQAIEEIERRMLSDALAASGSNQSEAARALGLSRVGLIKKLSRLGPRSAAGTE